MEPTSASSPASEEWTSDSNEPDGAAPGRSRSTPTDEESSSGGGPAFHAWMPYRTLNPDGSVTQGYAERSVVDALHGPTGNKEPLIEVLAFDWQQGNRDVPLTRQAEMMRRDGSPAVLISSAAGSPAKTSRSPASGRASKARGHRSGGSSTGSSGLFDLAGSSLRTYPDSFPLTRDAISPSFSRRWPSSGMAWPGECWTLDTSESPNDADECSLSDILEPAVPSRFYLSSRAAKGILRRARRRGRRLPEQLEAALENVTAEPDK